MDGAKTWQNNGTAFTSASNAVRVVWARVSLAKVLSALAIIAWAWHERARQRRALLALSPRELRDIGLCRADAEGEGRKPFWLP